VTEDAAPWSVQLFDIPSVGRSAVLTDPQGAVFSVLKPSQQP
jgi:predicted enzyme related to lactoylglutathione lyase